MRVFRKTALTCAFLLTATILAHAGPQGILPSGSAAKGWKQMGGSKVFNSRTIFDLVDGEADAILAYSFKGCAHGEYGPVKSAQPALTIDVYDMGDALNAYGLFSSSDRQSGRPTSLGSEGVVIGKSGLNFWKGQYLVRTTLIGRGAAFSSNQAAQIAFAKATAARITGPSGPPALLRALPGGRQPRSERYTRKNAAGQSFLNNAVSARYPSAGFSAELFISECASPAAAKASFEAYRSYEKSGTGLTAVKGVGDAAFSVNDRYAKTVVAARKGKYVVWILRAKDTRSATVLVKKAISTIR